MSRAGPTPDQRLLLEAALTRGPRSLAAWRRWRERVDPLDADPASYRLLPLLHRSLARQAVEDPSLSRLKGVRMRTWYANQILFARCGSLLERLHEQAIPTHVLKGGALAVLHYGDPGLRPMNDLDVLVPEERVDDAIAVLDAAGWSDPQRAHLATARKRHHAGFGSFTDGRGGVLDLHWHVAAQGRHPSIDRDFLANAIDLDLGGAKTRTLGPTEHLVLVLLHGATFWQSQPIHWIADALTLIEDAGSRIDWRALVELATRRRFTHTAGRGLELLCQRFGADVPAETRRALAAAPVSRSEIVEYRHRTGELAEATPRVRLAVHWVELARARPDEGRLRRLARLDARLHDERRELPAWIQPHRVARRALKKALRALGFRRRRRRHR